MAGTGSVLWLLPGLLACSAAPRLRVDQGMLEKITIENRLLLFDAENELNIAIDSRDQVVDEIEQVKEDLKRSSTKVRAAERDMEVFSDKGDVERARIAGLRAAAEETRIEYLEARLAFTRQRLTKERHRLVVAKAKFELAKVELVKRNNVPGATDLDAEEFKEQVVDYEEDVQDADDELQEAEAEMNAAEARWLAANKTLADATGGALGSRWLD